MSRTGNSGSVLAETAATIAIVVPLTFWVLFAAVEACQTYGIWQALEQGARQSARLLSTTYAVDPGIISNTGDQTKYGFDPVRITNAINDSSQLAAKFDLTTTPPSVTVVATYLSGQFNLPTFPQFDPLFLGSKFQIQASATYTLE